MLIVEVKFGFNIMFLHKDIVDEAEPSFKIFLYVSHSHSEFILMNHIIEVVQSNIFTVQCYAERDIDITSHLSVCLSVCPIFVCPSMTLRFCDRLEYFKNNFAVS